jgi:uncharacterized protein (DUF2062 family)
VRASPGRLRLKELAGDLFRRAKSEHLTPGKMGLSVGIGVFCACTPLLGLHIWMALALATLLRVNRLWAAVGSRASFGPVFAGIVFFEIETAHRLRTGTWASIFPRDALAHGRELMTDWVIGAGIVGAALGALAGLFAYGWAMRRGDRRHPGLAAPALVSPRTPDGPLPPSSGSPP